MSGLGQIVSSFFTNLRCRQDFSIFFGGGGAHVYFRATEPLFQTSSDVFTLFESQSGQPYFTLVEGFNIYKCIYIHSLRLTSGATPFLLYMASTVVCPHVCVSAEVGGSVVCFSQMVH